MVFTILFTLIINIPLILLVNFLIYDQENDSGSITRRWYAVIILIPLIYLNLLIIDFSFDRMGPEYIDRIRASDENEAAFIVTIWLIIIGVALIKFIKRRRRE